MVHPEAGHVVHHQPAHLHPLKGAEDGAHVVGEEARLDAVGRLVDRGNGLLEARVRTDGGDGRKDLLAVHPHGAGGAEQYRGLEDRSGPSAPNSQPGPACHRLGDPLGRPLGAGLVDHGANVGRLGHRVPGAESRYRCHEAFGEARVERLVHQDPLGGDAGLAGVEVSACHTAADCVVEVGVRLDHHGRVAAQLERHPLGGSAAADGPPGSAGSGEGDHPDPGVVDQRRRDLVGAEQDGDRPRRDSRCHGRSHPAAGSPGDPGAAL